MFEQAVLSSGPASKRVWTTFAGVTGQALLVTFAVMIPMIWPEAMPNHQTLLRIFIPTAPPAPPPKATAPAAPVAHAQPRPFLSKGLVIPTTMPAHPQIFADDPPAVATGPGVPGGMPSGSEHGIAGGIGLPEFFSTGAPTVAPPKPVERPAPAPHTETAAPPRVPTGGRVSLGEPIRRIEPRYPPLALQARIAGVVELEGVVGVDGRIRELRVKRGHPLLAPAAVDAVKQWLYRPTTLNGQPVEVIAPITVTFRLN